MCLFTGLLGVTIIPPRIDPEPPAGGSGRAAYPLRRACTHTCPPSHVHATHGKHLLTQIFILWEKNTRLVTFFAIARSRPASGPESRPERHLAAVEILNFVVRCCSLVFVLSGVALRLCLKFLYVAVCQQFKKRLVITVKTKTNY